jgi:hypothetical protein
MNYNTDMILGALECGGRVYPNALVLVTRNAELKRRLQARFGGGVEPGRWVLKSKSQRIKLLELWIKNGTSQEIALRAELYRLMS